MNGADIETPAYLPIFEINLIKEYAERLRRRQRMARIGMAVAIGIFLVSALFIFWAGRNMVAIQRTKTGIGMLNKELETLNVLYEKLDKVRTEAVDKSSDMVPFLPVCERRVEWAPKLAALGNALPLGMTIHKLDGESGDIFYKLLDEASAKAKKNVRRRKGSIVDGLIERKLSFSLIYQPWAPNAGDPIRPLLETLRDSEVFMDKMDDVQIEGTEWSTWDGEPVMFYRGTLSGVSKEP